MKHEWLSIDFDGDPMAETFMALVDGEPGSKDWRPAFYEDGKLLVRAHVPAGQYWIWSKVNGLATRHGTVRVD